MQTWASISRVCMWVLLAITLFFQIGTIVAIGSMNASGTYNTAPLAAATAGITVCVILFAVLRRGKVVPLAVAAVLGVCFIVIALNLQDFFGAADGTVAMETDLTVWEAIYRHMSPALLPVCMLPQWLHLRRMRQEEETAAELAQTPSLLGELGDYRMASLDEPSPVREKRSVRTRRRKESEQ